MEKEIEKKKFSLFGISIWKLCVYFILYSFLGYIIETLYGIVTMGVWQSRQSFLYGPFLGIYGVGAVIIILFSQKFNESNFKLFIGGFAIGTITEYMISFLVETFIGTRWWNYENYILNINGRICLLYSVFWGILTVFLIKKVNPKIEKVIGKIKEKVSPKILKTIILAVVIFLVIDCMATCYAQEQFITRMVVENNIEVLNKEEIKQKYEATYQNEKLSNFINTFWNDEKMIRTFPNIKIEDKNHNIIYIDNLLPGIQLYYIKVFEK